MVQILVARAGSPALGQGAAGAAALDDLEVTAAASCSSVTAARQMVHIDEEKVGSAERAPMA
jgi:hypothetical protein